MLLNFIGKMKDFERIDRLERDQYFIQQLLVKLLDIQAEIHKMITKVVKK